MAQDPAQEDLTSADAALVYGALEDAEAALATAGADVDLGISSPANLNAVEGAAYDTYNSMDTAEALALDIAKAEMATKKLALDGALAAEVTNLKTFDTAADKAAGTTKGLIDTYLSQMDAAAAAQKAEDAAIVVTDAKVAAASISLDTQLDAGGNDYAFTVTSASAGVVLFDDVGVDAFGTYEATYDASTNKWTWTLDGGADLTDNEVAADANLQKLLANADAKAALDAAAAEAEAVAATTAAETTAAATLAKIEAIDVDLTDGSTVTNDADDYASAVTALSDYADAKAAFDEALAAVVAARPAASSLAALEKTAADAQAAFLENDWALTMLDGAAEDATDALDAGNDVANDVFVFQGKDSGGSTIDHFGVAGDDVISFAAGKYTLVEVSAADFASTKAIGSASALEIFVVDGGTDTVLYVEQNAFDGATESAQGNLVDITLLGITDATIALDAKGYLTVA